MSEERTPGPPALVAEPPPIPPAPPPPPPLPTAREPLAPPPPNPETELVGGYRAPLTVSDGFLKIGP